MKRVFLFLMLFLVLISPVSAVVQDLGTIKQGKSVNLIQTCASCTFNNITAILDPSATQLIGNNAMTRTGSVYNFTLDASNTSEMGRYIINGIGDLEGTNEIWSYIVTVTADGKPFQAFPNQFSIILLGIILILFGLLDTRYRLLKHLGSTIIMIMGVLTIYPGYNFINHTTLLGLSLGTILIAIGFYFLIEDSFSREKQQEWFGQPQGSEEEETVE